MKKVLIKIVFSISLFPIVANAQNSITDYQTSPTARQVSGVMGYIYTDKGTPIKALKLDPTNPNNPKNTINNNGWTFANGEVWIDNTQIPIILKDEYKEISFKKIKDSDILVRYENNKVVYTLTACTPPKNSNMCDDKPHPDLFLFVLNNESKLKQPNNTKIYRYIEPIKK